MHNTIELTLIDPSLNERARGRSDRSVFERCSVGSVTAGTWVARLHGVDVPRAPQVVYLAAFVRPTLISRIAGGVRRVLLRFVRGAWARGTRRA